MARTATMRASNPAMAWMGAWMVMGTGLVSFGARRLQKDMAFQRDLLTAKPQEVGALQRAFWQGALDDYHEETGRIVELAHKAGMPDL